MATRDLEKVLPKSWGVAGGSYDDPSEKINWFNQLAVTEEELSNYGVSQSDINWMKDNGYNPTAVTDTYVFNTGDADEDKKIEDQYFGFMNDAERFNNALESYDEKVERASKSSKSSNKSANYKPNAAEFMARTGLPWQDATDILYGVIGSNNDTRDWQAIMASDNPAQVARQATEDMYGGYYISTQYDESDGRTRAYLMGGDGTIITHMGTIDEKNRTQIPIGYRERAINAFGADFDDLMFEAGIPVNLGSLYGDKNFTPADYNKVSGDVKGQAANAAPAIEYTDQQIADYIKQNYGNATAENLQDIVNEAIKEGVPIEQVARAIGAGLTPTEGGYSFSLPQAAAPAPTFTDQQVSDYIAQNFGAVNSGNFSDVINAAYEQGFSPEQIARVTGATLSPTEGGFSFSLPAAAPIEYTDQQIADYIDQNYGTVSAENFQAIVDQAVAENVPIEQLARVVGAALDTNDAGQISLTLPPAAVETQPMSLVDQLKAQQAATGITHQASFSKDQDKIIADMADKLGKYGVQDLTDLKPITGEIEYQLEERLDNGEPTGVFNLMQLGIGPEGDETLVYAGRTATPDEINQIRTKGTVTENVGVLNSRTGEEIPVNKLNNAEGSGFTYYKIEFSPDGIAVPYGYKEATGIGALGDQIKSIVSIPPIAAALAAVTAGAIGPEGAQLVASKPVAAAIGAGTVGYAGSGRLDTAAKAAATAFGVSYALQALGVDLTADQSARVNAVKDVPGYSSLTRTVDLGGGLTYDPVSNSILDANFGTSLNAATGNIEFPDGSIATTKDYGIYPSAEAAPPGATVTPVSPGSPIVSTNLPAASQNTVNITGSQVPELSALSGLPVGTRLLNPLNGNPAEITITADGVKQLTNIAALATGIQALGPGTTAQVNVDAVRQGTTQGGAAVGGAGAVQNLGGGNTAEVKVTAPKTGTDKGAAAAGAAATTKPSVIKTVEELVSGKKNVTDLTSDEVEALLKAGFTASLLLGGTTDSPTIPTTNIDTTAINTLRPGFTPDLKPTIPTVPTTTTTTTTTPGQQVYTNLGITTGAPTAPPSTPTTGIGSLPVPTYKPPPFLGAQAPGASRITPPVVTADPTFTQADFDLLAADIAAQQAALPPTVEQPPATPFESGLAKGTTVAKRAGGIVALRGGGIPLFQMGGPVAFAYGGMTAPVNEPRMLSGGGDGMSDSIPATINGTQPARLADGEFVIPADVVSDIGNGSSKAGAKELYAMMDRVRQSRHGTTKQPPEVNMNKVLPV